MSGAAAPALSAPGSPGAASPGLPGQTIAPGSVEKSHGEAGAAGAAANAVANTNEEARWRPMLGLPCQLTVDLPFPGFKVADFLNLQPGSVMATGCRIVHDVPLRVNGTLIGWGEFEGAGKRLAVRLTELA
jgi:flagellar motor switch/type III secretory pathway protein FliN